MGSLSPRWQRGQQCHQVILRGDDLTLLTSCETPTNRGKLEQGSRMTDHWRFIPYHPYQLQQTRWKGTHSFGGLGISKFIFTLKQEPVSSMKQRGASRPTRAIDDEIAWLVLPNVGAPAKCRHPRLTWDVPSEECSCQARGRGCMGVDRAHPWQGHDDFALEEL